MSIINRVLIIPENVKVIIKDTETKEQEVEIIGPQGKLIRKIFPEVEVVKEENKLFTKLKAESKKKELVGTLNASLSNDLIGVNTAHREELNIKGTGHKVLKKKEENKLFTKLKAESKKNEVLEFSLGASHPIRLVVPNDLEVSCPENNQIIIRGINKEKVGQFAAQIKRLRRRSPYKLKGIYDKNEEVKLRARKKV
jgi:large subunit ribosomal protein L6